MSWVWVEFELSLTYVEISDEHELTYVHHLFFYFMVFPVSSFFLYICISISSNNNKNKNTPVSIIGRSTGWLRDNRNESIIQVKSKSMNAQKRKRFMHALLFYIYFIKLYVSFLSISQFLIDYQSQWMNRKEKIHACFAFLYLLYYMFPFLVSPSFFLSLFIFSYLCLLYIMERNSYDVCVLYAVIQFHNRYFVHRFNDSFLLLPLSIKCVFILLSFASVLNCKINTS